MSNLQSFVNPASEEEYNVWFKGFVKKFPIHRIGGWDNEVEVDEYNVFIGRILGILDQLGETEDFFTYINPRINIRKNYITLINRLVEKEHPEMYRHWSEEYWQQEGVWGSFKISGGIL
jgi:hypothetical protein